MSVRRCSAVRRNTSSLDDVIKFLQQLGVDAADWQLVTWKHVEMRHGPPTHLRLPPDTIEITLQVSRFE